MERSDGVWGLVCKDIANFKRPRYVLFVKEYPMTASGKVQKFTLREIAMQELKLSEYATIATLV